MTFKLVSFGFFAALIVSAYAETRVCQGQVCTIVDDRGARRMNEVETRNHFREQVRSALANVDCSYATFPPECRALKSSLESQFR